MEEVAGCVWDVHIYMYIVVVVVVLSTARRGLSDSRRDERGAYHHRVRVQGRNDTCNPASWRGCRVSRVACCVLHVRVRLTRMPRGIRVLGPFCDWEYTCLGGICAADRSLGAA